MTQTPHEIGMTGVLGVGLILILWGLHRRSKSAMSKISLDDLLIGEDGKISKAAAVMTGSFVLTSWVVVFQTLNKSLSDATFGLYIGTWVVPVVTKLLKGPVPPVSSTETTIVTNTKEVTPP
jgi:hypothetical protein